MAGMVLLDNFFSGAVEQLWLIEGSKIDAISLFIDVHSVFQGHITQLRLQRLDKAAQDFPQ